MDRARALELARDARLAMSGVAHAGDECADMRNEAVADAILRACEEAVREERQAMLNQIRVQIGECPVPTGLASAELKHLEAFVEARGEKA